MKLGADPEELNQRALVGTKWEREGARIEFGSEGGCFASAPVDLVEPAYRTLLLGMKAEHNYLFRIVAKSG